MHVVYISGPLRAENAWEIEHNVRKAEELALEVWEAGMAAICPHTNTRFFSGVLPDNAWLKGDLAIIDGCSAILMTPNWCESEGAKAEEAHARRQGIPVFYDLDDLIEWDRLYVSEQS